MNETNHTILNTSLMSHLQKIKMLKVDKCCCCSLKIGAIILGVIILIFGFITAATNSWGFTGDQQMLTALGIGMNINNDYVQIEYYRTNAMAALVVGFIKGIIDILAASSLLFGACNSKPGFLLPILILTPVNLAGNWIFSIVLLVSTSFIGIAIISMFIVFLFLVSLFRGYTWVCVFSFWKQMKEDSRNSPV